ncbi:MAG: hypothetical protein ACRC9X_03050 [Bacteroidales bacterium]
MFTRTKHRYIGAVIGILLPFIVFLIAYSTHKWAQSPLDYLQFLVSKNVLSKVLSLCVLPNLISFFAAMLFKRDSVSYGILLSTVLWAVVVTILYFSL